MAESKYIDPQKMDGASLLRDLLIDGVKELTIRSGSAMPVKEPVAVRFTGQITAPGEFFINQRDEMIHGRSHVEVDRSSGRITFFENARDHYAAIIIGQIRPAKFLTALGINNGEAQTPASLAALLKRHRFLFANAQEGMAIIADLQNFKGKISTEIEKANDQRGNKTNLVRTAVETNTPLEFVLSIPLIEGQPAMLIRVEVCLDASDASVRCWLESVEAIEIIEAEKNRLIDAELNVFDGWTILEQ